MCERELEQQKKRNKTIKKNNKKRWFLKFIQSVVIKDNAQEHKLWKKKAFMVKIWSLI